MLSVLKREGYEILMKLKQVVDLHMLPIFEYMCFFGSHACWFGWREVTNINIPCPRPLGLRLSPYSVYNVLDSAYISICLLIPFLFLVNIGFDLYKGRHFHA